MTHDPFRKDAPPDPHREIRDPNETGAGVGLLLGALLLAGLGAFIYLFSSSDRQVATDEVRPPITQPSTTGSAPAPETTGTSANMPPAPAPRMEPKVKPVE